MKDLLCAKSHDQSPEHKEPGNSLRVQTALELRPRGGDPRAWGPSFPTSELQRPGCASGSMPRKGEGRLCLSAWAAPEATREDCAPARGAAFRAQRLSPQAGRTRRRSLAAAQGQVQERRESGRAGVHRSPARGGRGRGGALVREPDARAWCRWRRGR